MTATIYPGDCLDVMQDLPAESVDIIVTSPPYNIGVVYDEYGDKMTGENYLEWMNNLAVAMYRVLKPEGSLFLNIGSQAANPWFAYEVAEQFSSFEMILQNSIIWVKSIAIGDTTYGHFKPINSPRYLNNNYEHIFHFTKSGRVPIDRIAIGVPFMDKSNITRRAHTQDRRCAGNVWYIPYHTVQSAEEKFNHPAGFPLELPSRCIQMHGNITPKTVVLDPFMGTGTTLVAAELEGASSIGIELSAAYAETAENRLLLI
jgi:site-specific DNA-methyltransferase (adenine-specific)